MSASEPCPNEGTAGRCQGCRDYDRALGEALDNDYAMLVERIRSEVKPCAEHPMPFPKPSCWTCGRNGAFERAAGIVEGFARADAGVIF